MPSTRTQHIIITTSDHWSWAKLWTWTIVNKHKPTTDRKNHWNSTQSHLPSVSSITVTKQKEQIWTGIFAHVLATVVGISKNEKENIKFKGKKGKNQFCKSFLRIQILTSMFIFMWFFRWLMHVSLSKSQYNTVFVVKPAYTHWNSCTFTCAHKHLSCVKDKTPLFAIFVLKMLIHFDHMLLLLLFF